MLEHFNRFGVAQGFTMEPSEIVAQTSIFAFHTSHIGLAHNLVAWGNKAWIDRITITHPEVTAPKRDCFPQRAKRVRTMVAHHPAKNSRREMIHDRPDPQFVLLLAH